MHAHELRVTHEDGMKGRDRLIEQGFVLVRLGGMLKSLDGFHAGSEQRLIASRVLEGCLGRWGG